MESENHSVTLKSFRGDKIEVEFAGKNLWRLALDVQVVVDITEGVLRYDILKGFPTNMRSGSHVIDPIIPQFTGNNDYNLALLCHDFNYTKDKNGQNALSRLQADNLLRQMVLKSGVLGKFRAALMYRALRIGASSAYNCENAGVYANAADFMKFRWDAR